MCTTHPVFWPLPIGHNGTFANFLHVPPLIITGQTRNGRLTLAGSISSSLGKSEARREKNRSASPIVEMAVADHMLCDVDCSILHVKKKGKYEVNVLKKGETS